ncbi:MAG: type I DNA topoisomerase [Desulfobulbaceae bacterium]|uniref:DNA topoisomerase 1 n=1 Tax=Candidatus Desulfobia pelagia TaxID=2841692 RepID=A0A8J6TFJ6_9BACT|nr:type I DNA topoisomerase [Candidatus Desulfobia pelagia]
MSKSLIIVESPAKARTLQRYLGKTFSVKASVGHIRDLPVKTLGVDVENDFKPQYETIRGKGKVITELKSAAREADDIYLAPDPDREGEAIAWHIAQAVSVAKKPIHRVLFHELTKKAILEALANATDIDINKFEAQQARRILDRLVGYQISPLLWDKVRRGLSAGRVQSVAVRMVCDREQEIEAFQSVEYWSVAASLKKGESSPFLTRVEKISGKRIDKGANAIGDKAAAHKIVADLEKASFSVAEVVKKEKKRNPSPPFITSTMQIDSNRKLRFSAKKTMMLAQRLYEGIEIGEDGPTGLITYMRTDSPRSSDEAINQVREHITGEYGATYLPGKPRKFKTKKSAQDAHEAIRPTDVQNTPEKMAKYLEKDMLALYALVWKRFVASQMKPAVYDQTSAVIRAGKYDLKAVGTILRFPGFIVLYEESLGDPQQGAGDDDKDMLLPDLKKDDLLDLLKLESKQHFTQPPARYSEATLVKALEDNGVGRPSTYAAILSTIQDKEYVQLLQRKFFPTDLGKLVTELLVNHFPAIMNVDFTASMELQLDQVEEGKSDWQKVLQGFYTPFKATLEAAKEEMKSVKKSAIPTDIKCSECDGIMVIKWGRMGEFLACEKYPECKKTQDFSKDTNGNIIAIEKEKEEESGEACDKCGRAMVYKNGRFGRFLACSGYPECKNIRAETTGVTCPEEGCGGEIIKKVSKKGKVFYSCNKYPKCTHALWDKPVNQPCPDCGSAFLLEKSTKRDGVHLKCPNKECGYKQNLEDEG